MKAVRNSNSSSNTQQYEFKIGTRIRAIRNQKNYSLRHLAELSSLNINTLSMIENDKTSPSVATLQQIARSLEVPIGCFFEVEIETKPVVYTRRLERFSAQVQQMLMQELGKNYSHNAIQPFEMILDKGAVSGTSPIVHTGHEFVYCLEGSVGYTVDGTDYQLEEGDSIIFESHLPHNWINYDRRSRILLVIVSTDSSEKPGGNHFLTIGE